MVKTIISLIDSMFPGQKTYILLGMSMLLTSLMNMDWKRICFGKNRKTLIIISK